MDDDLPREYDVVVVGTGMVECVVAAAAARVGKKVLHIDKNDYYGVQWASFTLKGIHQWVEEVSATPAHTPPGECELGEGEQLVGVASASLDYTGVKQTWHVPKEPTHSPPAEPSTVASSDSGGPEEGPVDSPAEPSTVASSDSGGPEEGLVDSPSAEPSTVASSDSGAPEEGPVDSPSAEPSTVASSDSGAPKEGPVDENTQHTQMQDSPSTTPQDALQDAADSTTQETPPQPEEPKNGSTGEAGTDEDKEKKKLTQEELLNLSRKFNLDLAPKLLYSQGPMVELLISSNIARYVEFKCISRVLTWRGGCEGGLLVVPCSRSDVFTTSAVNLVEKRLLMKFLEFCHQYDRHPEELQDHLDKPFVDFLRSRKLTDNLIHFVTEAIGMVGEGAGCREGLKRTRAFLTSLGRYGTTPFLFSMYGSGELPQAFCRLCAVFEGIYILRKPVSSLVVHSPSNMCRGLLSEGEKFTCSHLVMSASHAPQEYLPQDGPTQRVSRAIFLTDRSILPHEKEQLTLLRVPAKEGNPHPVIVLEVGSGTHACPKDLYCVHMTCQGQDAESDLRVAVERLLATQPRDTTTTTTTTTKPRILWSLYFNHVDYSGHDLAASTPDNLYLCPGPNTDLDYDLAIEQARSIFGQMFPGEEFLPRAPDPEEIAFDNHGAEPKQGDTFKDEGNSEKVDKEVEEGKVMEQLTEEQRKEREGNGHGDEKLVKESREQDESTAAEE